MATANKAAATRTLLLEMSNGRRSKLTVPETAKVTFGLLHPGGKTFVDRNDGVWLRIYEGTKQTACISGVKAFRDSAYKMEVQKDVTTASEHKAVVDGRVKKHATDFAVVESTWEDTGW